MIFERTRSYLHEEAWRPWQSDSARRVLYHYTTAQGLHGIVSQRKFRLTHTRHLNDETEGLHGARAVDAALDTLVERMPQNQLIAILSQAMKAALSQDHSTSAGGTYVGCFSTEGDSLPQWRGYGRHDSAFALAIDAAKLLSLAQNSWQGRCWLLPVEYDALAFITKMSNALQIASEEFDLLKERHDEKQLLVSLILHLANYGSALKHHAFREEKEWRLIVLNMPHDTDPVMHHLADATFRPYVELEMGSDFLRQALEQVVIGPQSKQDAIKHGVASFLREQLGSEVLVTKSDVPYNVRV